VTGSTAVADDYSISLYASASNTPIEPAIAFFNAVTSTGTYTNGADKGTEVLYKDGLTLNGVYYVKVTSLATAGPLSIVFSYLNASEATIIPYSGADQVYPSSCQTFKCRMRPYSTGYVINRWTNTGVTGIANPSIAGQEVVSSFNVTQLLSNNVVSTVTSVGNFLPANIATSGIQYHPVTVDVVYNNMKDAAGNNVGPLMAIGRIVTNIGLEAENVVLRAADRFPLSTRNIATSSIATDRSVCGARYYEFELSDVNSVGGLYKSTAVGGTRLLPLNNTNGGGWSITPGVSGTGALAQNTIYMTRIPILCSSCWWLRSRWMGNNVE